MSIDAFVGAFQGGARPNLFNVTVVSSFLGVGAAEMPFMCQSASIPGRTIAPIEVPYLNRKIPYAGDPTYPDFQMTITNDIDFLIRSGFENWQQEIQGRNNVEGQAIPGNYFGTAFVTQLNRDKSPLRTYKLLNCWPTEVSPIELSFTTDNQVETFTVTLKYSHFDIVV